MAERSARALRLAVLGLSLWPASAGAAGSESLESAVKATFLYKFAQFVEWPADTIAQGAPFLLCAVGDDQVTALMDRAAAGQRVANRPVMVRHLQRVAPADGCHAVYLAGSPAQSVDDAAAALHGIPVLTIADSVANPRAPTIIKFVVGDNRVRFDIDDAEAAQDRLFVSSKLLELARSVRKRR
jgi:hypothetical protein